MRVPVPLIGPSYTNRSLPLSAQETKNLFPEVNPESRNIVSLHAFPGLLEFNDTSGNDRGSHVMGGVLYVVFGTTLYSVDEDGNETSIGTISGDARCDFADNGNQMMIACGAAYMYTASTNTLEVITDTDLIDPTTVGYINSQFIFDNNSATSEDGEFVTTQLLTDLEADDVVNPLDFAKADAHPDDISRIVIYNEQVYFFGSDSIEPWWNSGVGSPPFDPINGAVRPYGLGAKWSLDVSDEAIYFLDDKRIPRQMVGLQVNNIGNPAVGQAWAKYPRVDDAVGFTFTLDHANFYQINFPTAGKSWLYHESTGSWYELGNDSRHPASSLSFVYGKNLVNGHSGKVYELDFDTYTNDGEAIQRKRVTAVIHGGLYQIPGKELWFDRVEFIVETGVGIMTGQGSDPQIMIRFSDDSGRTWSAEDWYTLGVGGDYLRRVVLQNQGRAYQRIYELTYSEPTKFSLIDAHADISVGP